MKRTKQEALETRERILDAAEVAFSTQGVAHTALEDIAAAAGVTRGAIYGHFRNKSELFDAMVERVEFPMRVFVEATASPEAVDPLGLMRSLMVRFLTDASTEGHTHRVFDVLFTKCEYSSRASTQLGSLLARTTRSAREARDGLARGVHNAIRKGQLPADLDVTGAAAMMLALTGGALRGWLLDPTSIALPREAGRVADAALDLLRFSAALRTKPLASGISE